MLRTFGIANNHIRLARKGQTIDAVLVSETAMPDFSPATNWTKVSDSITTLKDTPVPGNTLDIVKTTGGRQDLRQQIRIGPISRKITFTQEDTDELIRELETMSGRIDTSAATAVGSYVEYAPFSGGPIGIEGWWHLQQYNQDNELVHLEVLWGELRLADGVTTGNNIIAPQLELTVFPNSLNLARDYRPTVNVA